MMELFAQVWLLCVVAFLAGSGVTWLLFVRVPHQLPGPNPPAPVQGRPERSLRPDPVSQEPRRPPTVPQQRSQVEPALANLDTHHRESPHRHTGSTAAGALDDLGVAGRPRVPEQSRPASGIPGQAGPVDGPAPGTAP